MKIITLSFSQNRQVQTSNSYLIAKVIEKIAKKSNEVSHIKLSDFDLSSCNLCGQCSKTQRCASDQNFNKIYEALLESDLTFFIIPHYSPFPSKLMILLEKFNQIYYTAALAKQDMTRVYTNRNIGLIVHGGMVHNQKVEDYYKKMISKPISFILKSQGNNVLQNEQEFVNGVAFGLESEEDIIYDAKEIFPIVRLEEDFVEEKISAYVKFTIDMNRD